MSIKIPVYVLYKSFTFMECFAGDWRFQLQFVLFSMESSRLLMWNTAATFLGHAIFIQTHSEAVPKPPKTHLKKA